MAEKKKKKAKAPSKAELVELIDRLTGKLQAEREKSAKLEAELARLQGPVSVTPGPAIPRGSSERRRKAEVASFMTVKRTPKE